MLEFHERFRRDGKFYAILVSDELKAAGSTCVVRELEPAWDGTSRYQRKTCNGSAGSTRYQGYRSLDEAYADSRKWAKRKIAAHQRSEKHLACQILARFARMLVWGNQWGPR